MFDRKILSLFEAQGDSLLRKVNDGIEKNRKGDAKITLTDAKGSPLTDATVKIEQMSHEFRFGANLFMLDELETPEKNESYKSHFTSLFNMATLPFYWDSLEPEEGKTRYAKDSARIYRRPAPDLCIEFCEKHGIEPREHALAYESFFPKWLYDAPIDRIKDALARRYEEISSRYADKIPTIEVTNEMLWQKGKTAFYEDPDYVEWCFRLADKHFPKNKLVINESTGYSWGGPCRTVDAYYAYTEALRLKGVRVDAIGLQYHMFWQREDAFKETRPYYDPDRLFAWMDLYARFGKPLQITEVTIPSYSWEKEDEELQADILEYLYSIWFSHPAVEQIVYWNLVDGYAHVWDPDPAVIAASQGDMTTGENYYHGGLLRFDLSEKPAYTRLCELIRHRWHTSGTYQTNSAGEISFRGFFGNYDVTVIKDGKETKCEITLSKNGNGHISLSLDA